MIVHVVRCDAKGCSAEAPLQSTSPVNQITGMLQVPTPSIVPGTWLQVSGKQFCSWRCIAEFGRQAASEGREVV